MEPNVKFYHLFNDHSESLVHRLKDIFQTKLSCAKTLQNIKIVKSFQLLGI